MKKIAVILAKEESKRLKKKNFLTFGNRPILEHSIEIAKKTNILTNGCVG